MPSTPLSTPNITIRGPFWSAEATVVAGPLLSAPDAGSTAADIIHARNLFVADEAQAAFGFDRVHVPGTIIALCFVESVVIRPEDEGTLSYEWRRAQGEDVPPVDTIQQMRHLLYEQQGQLSLLLLETDPQNLADKAFTCTAGDINLGVLQSMGNALQKLYRALDLNPIQGDTANRRWAVSVHSSGLSIFGEAFLPWEKDPIQAPFQLARIWPDPIPAGEESPRTGFRLTVEADRLIEDEERDLRHRWRNLSRYLSPKNPLTSEPVDSAETPTPTWATLEITNPLGLPRLFWEISPWQEEPESLPLHFERTEFNLLLTDQQPHDLANRPTSLAQLVPDDILVAGDEKVGLEISIQVGPKDGPSDRRLKYQCEKKDTAAGESYFQEQYAFTGMEVAYNPVETPESLRDNQDLPIPEWFPGDNPDPVAPAVIWGFMPLEDGWAQLPVPNLTEQIYLDAGLANLGAQAGDDRPVLLRGAVSLGNQAVLASHRDEQPWDVTLVSAQRAQGVWRLKADNTNGGFALDSVELNIFIPDIILNGLFWFSTGKPTVEDALPDLDDWISGLQSIPLTTISENDLFPAPVKLTLDAFTVSLRKPLPAENNASTEAPSALLTSWSFTYAANETVIQEMVAARVLPEFVFSQFLALVWRRHATLPMIQALPLTQSKAPPNHPNASRQLAPFELPVAENGDDAVPLPSDWRFEVSGINGVVQWPRLLGEAPPAAEWKSLFDLPLVALSLIGLTLDPNLSPDETGLGADADTLLPVQYRFDVPYTDQLNALAQLPKVPRKPEEVSPLPDSPPPEPPKPLTRETFLEHWKTLSTQASLASADAIEAFHKQNDQTFILHLIEPYTWPVRPAVSLEGYPGSMTIENESVDDPATITLQSESALRGISGHFVLKDENGHLERLADGKDDERVSYLVEAGSMAAHPDGANGAFHDQRGLMRSTSVQTAKLLKTPVKLQRKIDVIDAYELTSTLEPIALSITKDVIWQFWFRDLPVEEAGSSFIRAMTRSSEAEDINDPEALSREFNYLNGYEWRLGEPAQIDILLPIYGLHFYPLTLEAVHFEDDVVKSVEIVGRLQLPLPGSPELENFSNAVRLTFTRDPEENQLKLSAIDLDVPMGEWPLALEGGEATDAPRLEWKKVSLNNELNQIEIGDIRLKFFLFDVEWSLQLDPIVFSSIPSNTLTQAYTFDVDESSPLYPRVALLEIDLASFKHNVSLTMMVQLGDRRVDSGLVVHYRFEEGDDPAVVYDVSGVGDPLNLTAQPSADIEWLPGGGLAVKAPTLLASDGPATKIIDAVRETDEITIEAWVKPANTTQKGPARIVSISKNPSLRNTTLGQQGDRYAVHLRTRDTDLNGRPALWTPVGVVTTDLTHLVYTRDAGGAARIYINGAQVASGTVEGDLDNWDTGFQLLLANEKTENRAWQGEYYQVSIYNRALTASEVDANLNRGLETTTPQPASEGDAFLPFEIGVSIFDGTISRTWPRLDSMSLEENWFKLQNPLEEPQPAGLQSVIAAQPNTPARLSRSVALRRAFNTFRRVYPPTHVEGETPPAPITGAMLVWRQGRLMVIQGASTVHASSTPPYSWHLTGLLIRCSDLSGRSTELRRYPAATLLPALLKVDDEENRFPVSFAVSPYLGLGFRTAESQTALLASVELLCLDPASKELRPVASRFLVGDAQETTGAPEANIHRSSLVWGQETHLRLAPESPVAVLRFRQINDTDTEGLLTTSYSFATVTNIQVRKKLSKRVFQMRTAVTNLRFREGQFGGAQMPEDVLAFEIAPPQTTGVQPFYLTEVPSTGETKQPSWPWGLSALRISVEYTHGKEGVVGKIPGLSNDGSDDNSDASLTLWWQAPQHFVQYRSALSSKRPAAGLPKLFRAPAIMSLLPVLPNPPMPSVKSEELFLSSQQEMDRWQPVLPGALRYLLVGARAGVMFAIRNQLLRQSGLDPDEDDLQEGKVLVSGSVPVQHRTPRPVPLPANENTDRALQPWASYFEPKRNLLVTTSPADEAFFAAFGDQPAKRLRMILREPEHGVIPPNWSGDLVFEIDSHTDLVELDQWDIAVNLISGDTAVEYQSKIARVELFGLVWDTIKVELVDGPVSDNLRTAFSENGIDIPTDATLESEEESVEKWRVISSEDIYLLERHEGELKIFRNHFKFTPEEPLDTAIAGDELMIVAKIAPHKEAGDKDTGGFAQKLSFQLRLSDESMLPLPLEPRFIHFEDPEYNRRLASSSAHSAKNIKVEINGEQRLHTLTIAADRKEYNPDSELALRYDWDDEFNEAIGEIAPTAGAGKLLLQGISSQGIATDLYTDEEIAPGVLRQYSLDDQDGKPRLKPGDKLRISVEIEETDPDVKIEKTSVVLQVDIVDEPVTPVPEAGYALLHAQDVEGRPEVECVRFAWNPEPLRIELVCSDDLTTEVVRRRAVFHWTHSVRPGRSSRHVIQKIAQSGSTHFPQLESSQ